MQIEFNLEELNKIEELKSHYPKKEAVLMPVLWMAQKKFGWISNDVKRYISEILDLPVSQVEGVTSFYTMYHKKPMGKYHIQVCTNISCMLREGEAIYNHLCSNLGIKHNECTSDGKFSIEEVECMGACGGAPMFAINEDYYENVNITKVDNIINSLQ